MTRIEELLALAEEAIDRNPSLIFNPYTIKQLIELVRLQNEALEASVEVTGASGAFAAKRPCGPQG